MANVRRAGPGAREGAKLTPADRSERSRQSGLLRSLKRLLGAVTPDFSVAAWDLSTGEKILIRPDEVYPSASVIKIAILTTLFAERDAGRLDLEQMATVRAEDIVEGSGILQEMHAGLQVTLRDLAHLMIVISDNTATNMLIGLLGAERIDALMRTYGLSATHVGRKMMDFQGRVEGRDNFTTAAEMCHLLERLWRADAPPLREESCAECLQILRRQQHHEKLPRLLPKGTISANKPGGLDDVSHDVALIEPAGGQPYVAAIFSRDFPEDVRMDAAIADASLRLYRYFTGE